VQLKINFAAILEQYSDIFMQIAISFGASFVISFVSIPLIIRLARINKLYDAPGGRKIHEGNIPSFGGLAIFLGFVVAMMIWIPTYNFRSFTFLYGIGALLILVILGLRDDIIPLKWWPKLFGQLIAAFVVIYFGDTRLTSMYGFFGIGEIPALVSYPLTILIILGIINSYNMIDGVNGLAASLGIIASLSFGTWFMLTGHNLMMVVAFALAGGLAAFLKFNLTPSKIFMGDTGSLFVGFLLSVMAIRFIEYNRVLPVEHAYHLQAASSLAIAIIFIPIFDTLRLIVLRLLSKRSPFSPDKNHIHHLLIRLGLTHGQTTLVLSAASLVIIGIVVLAQPLGNMPQEVSQKDQEAQAL
jgi:UDP-N-acetylmuramyl pentapeptide phosphotransferase/UDP-N-acetylglucosamine-1-phosphate transferase